MIGELHPNHTPNKGTLKKDLTSLVQMGRVVGVPTDISNGKVIWYCSFEKSACEGFEPGSTVQDTDGQEVGLAVG